jgi:RNA polymerase sigma factor (sigma-70 family)
MAQPRRIIELRAGDRETLEQWVRSRTTAQRLVERARIVLSSADGHSNSEICELLSIAHPTVTLWYQIGRNRLIDTWRKQGRHQAGHAEYDEQQHAPHDPQPGPEQQLSLSRDQQRLQAALADLPAEQREVFLLRAHGDLELAEIAELTQIPAETVKSRLRYALQKLRRLLADPAAEELPV